MADTPDLSRVISMIMNNPKLVEEISEMAKGDATADADVPEVATEAHSTATPASMEARMPGVGRRHDQRVKLLGAMKAYLSPERARAVDTMMNILDILEMTGGRG